MASPIKFSDLGKTTNDLLSKDFPIGILKVEGKGSEKVTNKTVSKLNLTGSHDQATGSTQGELKSTLTYLCTCPRMGKLQTSASTNTPSSLIVENTATLFSSGSLTDQIEVKDVVLKGLNLSTSLSLGPNVSTPTGLKVGVDFSRALQKNMALSSNTFFDWFKGPLLQNDSTFRYDSFVVGAQLSYGLQKRKIEAYNVAMGYESPSFKAILSGLNGVQTISAAFYQKFASGVETGYKASWNRAAIASSKAIAAQGSQTSTVSTGSASPFLIEVVSKFPLEPGSWLKTKLDNNGKVSLSYGVSINSRVTMIVSGSHDVLKKESKDENSSRIGLGFVVDF